MNLKRVVVLKLSVLLAVVLSAVSVQLFAQNDSLDKFLLIKLSREKSQVLCQSEVFTQCMGMKPQQCTDLSEKAIEQCLGPLPETINLKDLQNATLESCPKEVYEEAGFTDEKAQACLQEAMQ